MTHDLSSPRVFDGALPPRLFEALASATATLPSRSLSFWTDLQDTEPALVAAVLRRLRCLVGLPSLEQPGAGAEWWVRRAPAYHFQPWHVDKDEALFMRDGVVRSPAAATILYLGDAGGATIFSSQVCAPDGLSLVPRRLERAWTIPPRANRFVACRGDAAHAVLPSRDTTHGVRVSIPINWWPSPTVRNARLAADVADHPELTRQMSEYAEADSPAPPPARVRLRTWSAADLPRPVEQRWPAWTNENLQSHLSTPSGT